MATRSKLAVILHADVVGSTAHVQKDERIAHERMQQVFRGLSDTIASYDGTTHELRGDALVGEFERASDAVSAALKFQADSQLGNEEVGDDRLDVRIGIALGEVVIADNTVTGAGVVLAQRLEQLAEPGGLCISAAVREALPARLPFQYGPLGEQKLKGFDEPVRVFFVALGDDATVPEPEPALPQPSSARRGRWLAAGVLVLIAAAGAMAAWWQPWEPGIEPANMDKMAFALPDRPSIAVLPLTNMSDDASQEYFADGMTEDLITDLSKLSGLFVVARNSTFTYKGRAVKISQVAEELGVRYVLEGSVRRAGTRVRINAQLIDAVTGGHLWAEKYDGDMSDVFAVQDRVTGAIVKELAVKLLDDEKTAIANRGTDNIAAHDAFLLGWAHYQTVSPDTWRQAIAAYEQALSLDPDYPAALGGLALVYIRSGFRGFADELGVEPDAAPKLLQKALRNPTPHVLDAQLQWMMMEARFAGMPAIVNRLVALAPNYAQGYVWRGSLALRQDDVAAAEAAFDTALRLNPLGTLTLGNIGRMHLQAENYTQAIAALERWQARDPDDWLYLPPLAASYAHDGRFDAARKIVDRLLELRRARGIRVSVVKNFDTEKIFHPKYTRIVHEGLRLAGLPEKITASDLGLSDDDLVTGAELEARRAAGSKAVGQLLTGQWMIVTYPNGPRMHYWRGAKTGESVFRIDGDTLRYRVSRNPNLGERHCRIYKYKQGRADTFDSHVALCGHGTFFQGWFALSDGPPVPGPD